MELIPTGLLKKSGFFFTFTLACFGIAGTLHAEQIMDSVDVFSVARSSAYDRVKNGNFKDALSAEEEALKSAENQFGRTHPSIVPVLNDLATIYRYMGNYEQAEADLKWGLAIREKTLGPDDPLVAESLDQLACLYNDWGKWEEGEFWEKKAFSILEKQTPMPSEDLCQSLNHFGEIKLTLGQVIGAQNLLKRSLELQEKEPTPYPAQLIDTLNLLSQAYRTDKRFPDAEYSLQKSLEIARKSFPANSVEVADSSERLADFYHFQGLPEKAEPLYESALKIYKRFVGVDFSYPSVPYLCKLSKAYQSVGNDKLAGDLLEKALKTTKEILGPNHPRVAIALLDLAAVEKRLGEKQTAREHSLEALDICKSYFPKDHPLVVKAQSQLEN